MATFFSHKGRRERRSDGGVAPSTENLHRFSDDPVDDLGGWWNIMDQPDGLAGDHGGDVKIAGGLC